MTRWLDNIITEQEVDKQIKDNKKGKSCYIDNITNETLQYADGAITETLTELFNAVLSMGFYPRMWNGATLTPLHKKGDREVTGNYRAIAVSSCMGKTLNALLNKRLTEFMEIARQDLEKDVGHQTMSSKSPP